MSAGLYLRMASRLDDAEGSMRGIGVCREGIEVMAPKMGHFIFMARAMDPRGANILKQEMLAVGGEAAISYTAITDLSTPTDCLISGTERQLRIAIGKLACQPFGLRALSADIASALDELGSRRPRKVGPLKLGGRTTVMGIINTSPDSFSGDGHDDLSLAEAKAAEMEREGAGIIDVGGASTRPGSSPPGTREELDRVVPLVRRLRRRLKVPISVDSRDPEVIAAAVKAGARVVNLVGGIRTAKQARSLARLKVPVVLMHMQGEPADMQDGPEYRDVMDDIVSELRRQVGLAGDCGIPRGRLLADPGFGFGKTTEHNLDILRRLGEMRIIGLPVLVGASRKSFVGKILGTEVGDRLEGSVAAAVLAAANGADIVRVHDVRETVQALKLADAARRTGR